MTAAVQDLSVALGFPAGSRLLIAHQDDVAMCHGANTAFAELAGRGVVTCGSAMVPCPWFRELVGIAARDPRVDIGVHLTLTSEWAHYRWRPISTTSRASGLIDPDGYMWRSVPKLRAHMVVDAVEQELRAQIDAALAAGLDVSHLDAHMGAALVPELVGLYLQLGLDYGLPVLFPRHVDQYFSVLECGPVDRSVYVEALGRLSDHGMPAVDYFCMTPGVPTEDCETAYMSLVRAAPPGLTFMALHCNAPGDIEAIVPDHCHWRIDEYDLFRRPDFLDWIDAQEIELIGFRPIRDLWRSRAPGTAGGSG
ncbi:MAG: polysaccharide deacetylase family protein [Alphaproteobacteria bacterium]